MEIVSDKKSWIMWSKNIEKEDTKIYRQVVHSRFSFCEFLVCLLTVVVFSWWPCTLVQKAIKKVQPSALREGFATVPDVTWDDVGAMRDVRDVLDTAILVSDTHWSQKMLQRVIIFSIFQSPQVQWHRNQGGQFPLNKDAEKNVNVFHCQHKVCFPTHHKTEHLPTPLK